MDLLKDGGADRRARCLGNAPDKQMATSVAMESLGQNTIFLRMALDIRLSLDACVRADKRGAMGVRESSSYRARRMYSDTFSPG